jgi:large subunit ribosomal protein L9
MKVILKQDVDNLGDAGEIVDVADGYGNNYLLPRGLAMRATKGAVADAAAIRSARVKRDARTREEAEALAARLGERPVTISAKAGSDGTLYGSVTNVQIAEAVTSQLGYELDRRRIPLERPLKELGEHEIEVRLHPEVVATIHVQVAREEE